MRRVWEAVMHMTSQFVCIYCGNFAGTYDEVQAHQASAHGYGQ